MYLPELLAPAGNFDKFRTCLLYGADAVYLGGKSGNLRAACEGFDRKELPLAVAEAEVAGSRVYYCLNSLPMESDMRSLPATIEDAAGAGVHAFIIADPGVLALAKEYAPGVPVHLSTQANTTNSVAVNFWREQGVERVNLARELSCRDIFAIHKACGNMELEVFVHGAMCLAVSGQCLLSAWLNNRSGNQGRCTQPCRFEYRGMEVETLALQVDEYTRPEEPLWRVEQGERYSSFWAPQDLCLLPWLSWFGKNRITALKIEGRMKSAGWIAQVLDAYRAVLDAGAKGTPEAAMCEVLYAATRPLGSGFFIHGKRRNLTEEYLRETGIATRPNRSGEALLPEAERPLLAQVLGQASLSSWHVQLIGNWDRASDVEILLPGMERPVLVGGSYGLENSRGELCGTLGNGTKGVMYGDVEGLQTGVFIRKAG